MQENLLIFFCKVGKGVSDENGDFVEFPDVFSFAIHFILHLRNEWV
jgi:hypothetical protein